MASSFEEIMEKFLVEFNSKTDEDFSKEFTVSSGTWSCGDSPQDFHNTAASSAEFNFSL